jgi:hypothetical protein
MAIYSEFFPLKKVLFHSYVGLPEGTIASIILNKTPLLFWLVALTILKNMKVS